MSDSQKWFLMISLAALGFLTYLLAPVLTPFLISALLAYLGDPLVDRFERHFSRSLSVVIVFFIIFAALFLIVAILVPILQQEIVTLVKKLPGYIDFIQTHVVPRLQRLFSVEAGSAWDLSQIKEMIAQHWQGVGSVAAGILNSVSKSGLAFLGWLANLVLIPVLTFYLLRDWDIMVAHIHELIPKRWEPRVVRLARECDEVLGAFMHGQLLVMISLGTVYSIGLWLVGLDMSLLIGMGAGLVSFVPYLGFILGMLVAGIAAIMQFHEALPLLYVLAVFGVGQLLESFLLTPYLLGDRIGLHPVVVIFAVMAGGQLFGFFGILLALPVAAVIMVVLRHLHEDYVNSRLYGGGAPHE